MPGTAIAAIVRGAMPNPASPLAQAFHLLLDNAPAERADQALRLAIRVLVDSPRVRLGNRSPNIGPADEARWRELKAELRQQLAATKIGMSTVAKDTALPLSTIQRSLSPNGPVPGRAIARLLEQWRDQHHADDKAPPPPAPSGNGAVSPAAVPNGHDESATAALPANRLTSAEADQLLGHLSHMSAKEVRAALSMTPELAADAAALKEMQPEAVARVRRFLAH